MPNPSIIIKCECGSFITDMEVPPSSDHGYAIIFCQKCKTEYNLYAKMVKRVNAPKKDNSIKEKREGYGR